MKFTDNMLSLLVYQAKRLIPSENPCAPLVHYHKDNKGDYWQVIVSKVPIEERKVA